MAKKVDSDAEKVGEDVASIATNVNFVANALDETAAHKADLARKGRENRSGIFVGADTMDRWAGADRANAAMLRDLLRVIDLLHRREG